MGDTATVRRNAQKSMGSPGVQLSAGLIVALVALAAAMGAVIGVLVGYGLPGGGPGGPSDLQGTPEEYVLKALINGYVGVGGEIDGKKNPTLQASTGYPVTLTIVAGEAMEHDLAIDEVEVHMDHVKMMGDSATTKFTPMMAGTYSYYCTVPGHRQAGMAGKLVVSGKPGTGPGPDQHDEPGPARSVDVPRIARSPTAIPPPITRTAPAKLMVTLETKEVVAELESGVTFIYWTYNGTVPGPFIRVRVGDTVEVHLKNAATSGQNHSVDFHAVTGPGGGAVSTQTGPGKTTSFTFKALNPGIFVYHCASPHIPSHISMGMYGLILVEPEGGLPKVDREFYIMQGDLYTKWVPGTKGHQEVDGEAMFDETPTYVVFNGAFKGFTGPNAMTATVNQTVRIYFGVGGPNVASNFHVIGEIFDRVYPEGDLVNPPHLSVQTTVVPPGGATVVEFRIEVPGSYILVDHALTRSIDKGSIAIIAVSGAQNPDVYKGGVGGGHE